MQSKVIHVLEKIDLLTSDDKLLVGVSGGPDSICLLHLLSAHFDYQIIVAHLDHQLRPESSEESKAVRTMVEKFGWNCVVGSEDTLTYSRENRLSIEESAREVRYQFLFSQAEKYEAKAVLVGHHADDQVETVLMHFLRGTGLAGLGGMQTCAITPWHKQIPLLRPMLNVWRSEIDAYLLEHQLETLVDPSNQDTTFFRNRLRHELIPYLEEFNPKIRSIITQMADTLRGDYEVLSALTDEAMAGCLLDSSEEHAALNLPAFLANPVGMQRNMIRHVVGLLRPGLRDFGFQDVERALGYLQTPPNSGQGDLAAGLRILVETERFIIADWKAGLLHPEWPQWSGEALQIAVPGHTALDNVWQVSAEIFAVESDTLEYMIANPSPLIAYFDLDTTLTPLNDFASRSRETGWFPMGWTTARSKLAT